jgi:hypothetical protein
MPAARDLVLSAGATLVALVLAEAALRLFGLGPQIGVVYRELFQLSKNPVLRYELRPGAADGAHTISAAGHRGEDIPKSPPPETFRIAALGDSVTFGLGVERELAWPQLLESLLYEAAAAAPRFEVLNFGVTGYDVLQVAESARVLALRYQPQLLVYGYVLNDPQDFSFEGAALGRIADFERSRGPARWLSRSRLFLWLRSLAGPRHYGLAPEGILGTEGSALDLDLPSDPAWQALDAGGLAYFRALHQRKRARLRLGFDALAAAAGELPVLLAIFPVFPEEGPYPLGDVHALIRAEAVRVGFHVVDLLPAYTASGEYFGARKHVGNALHPNAFGNRIASHVLLAAALQEGLLPEGAIDPSLLLQGSQGTLARLASASLSSP